VFSFFRHWRAQRQLSKTIAALTAAEILQCNDEHELIRLGDLCERGARIDLAAVAYQRAAQIYEHKEMRQKVVAMRKRVVVLLPESVEAHVDLARALDFIGRRREAALSYNTAADLSKPPLKWRLQSLARGEEKYMVPLHALASDGSHSDSQGAPPTGRLGSQVGSPAFAVDGEHCGV
jgi:tetratricopeptide (TPR) repeat protein